MFIAALALAVVVGLDIYIGPAVLHKVQKSLPMISTDCQVRRILWKTFFE